MLPELQKFYFDVDALTSGDAEYSTTDYEEAYTIEQAVDSIRNRYYDNQNRIFRLRHIYDRSKPWQTNTVYLAKGQDY